MDREIPPSGFTKSGKTLGKPRVLPDLVTPRVGFPYPHLYGMKESYSIFLTLVQACRKDMVGVGVGGRGGQHWLVDGH